MYLSQYSSSMYILWSRLLVRSPKRASIWFCSSTVVSNFCESTFCLSHFVTDFESFFIMSFDCLMLKWNSSIFDVTFSNLATTSESFELVSEFCSLKLVMLLLTSSVISMIFKCTFSFNSKNCSFILAMSLFNFSQCISVDLAISFS